MEQSLFDNAVVVSTYTDSEAIEDGLLVAINQKDRVTRAVWEFLAANAPKGSQPPYNWPVDLVNWFKAGAMKKEAALKLIAELGKDKAQAKYERIVGDRKAFAMSMGLISTNAVQAKKVYDENIDGGIFKYVGMGKTFWLIPNENGGITLMLPEDY